MIYEAFRSYILAMVKALLNGKFGSRVKFWELKETKCGQLKKTKGLK